VHNPKYYFRKNANLKLFQKQLNFFRNIWISFEQQGNLKFDMLFVMTELVRGMGLFLVWHEKLFCMHVAKFHLGQKKIGG